MKRKTVLNSRDAANATFQPSKGSSQEMNILDRITFFLNKNARNIVNESISAHRIEANLTTPRYKKVRLIRNSSIDLVLILAKSVGDIANSKRIIEQFSVSLARFAIEAGLTIEETIDSHIFLKKLIFDSLDKSSLLKELDVAEMYQLVQSLTLYSDIVSSQIAFSFHYQYVKSLDQLRQSEEKFSKVFELGPGAFTITELDSGKIVNANEKFLKMTGYSLHELIGKDAFEAGIFSDRNATQAYRVRRQLLAKTGYLSDYYVGLRTKLGEKLYVKRSAVVVQINGNKHVVTSNYDVKDSLKIKHQKDIYKELHNAHEELKKIAEAKEQFIGIASHQLRTPATAVKQYIGMILFGMAGKVTQKQRHFLERAYSSNERQIVLINDLLKTAQIDTSAYQLQKEEKPVASLIKKVIKQLGPTLENRNQTVQLIDKSNDAKAHIDPVEIDLVFSNILENASKYSPDNSELIIFIEVSHEEESFVEVSVRDRGVGIDSDYHVSIFDKFTRVMNERSTPDNGTGLGLYWVKAIVDMHGGKVIVESKKGQGSTFTIRLPL
jgi:PAS domain S-box-containing protein